MVVFPRLSFSGGEPSMIQSTKEYSAWFMLRSWHIKSVIKHWVHSPNYLRLSKVNIVHLSVPLPICDTLVDNNCETIALLFVACMFNFPIWFSYSLELSVLLMLLFIDYRLVIVCSNEAESMSYFISKLHMFKRTYFAPSNDDDFKKYLVSKFSKSFQIAHSDAEKRIPASVVDYEG